SGATRIAARTVPRTRDPAALSADTFSVVQKASRIVWPSLRRKSIMSIPAVGLTARGEIRSGFSPRGHIVRSVRLLVERDVELADRGWRLRGYLRQVPRQRRPPAAVVEHGLQRLVDGGNAPGVALLDADSVDLVAEEGADHLELAFVLRLGRET